MKSHGMKLGWLGVAVACGLTATLQAQRSNGPLTIASQGSFFVGGEKKQLPQPPAGSPGAAFGGGEIMVHQMYVQYQIPARGERHVPVVMVHGCCLSSKTWETTPDGRRAGTSISYGRTAASISRIKCRARVRVSIRP